MSVTVMSLVWQYSHAKGGELIILLAIADHADDDGRAFPGEERLAQKGRMTTRHVINCLKSLERSEELLIKRQRGRGRVNHYVVNLPLLIGRGKTGKDFSEKIAPFMAEKVKRFPKNRPKPEKRDTPHYNDARAEPSVTTYNHHRDIVEVDSPEPSQPNLLTVEYVVEGWNLLCGGKYLMPRKRSVPESLKRKVRLRLKEHPDQAFWETVFNFCVATPFWRGDNERGWAVTFEWLMTNDTNCVKVYERATNGVEQP